MYNYRNMCTGYAFNCIVGDDHHALSNITPSKTFRSSSFDAEKQAFYTNSNILIELKELAFNDFSYTIHHP